MKWNSKFGSWVSGDWAILPRGYPGLSRPVCYDIYRDGIFLGSEKRVKEAKKRVEVEVSKTAP